MPWIDQLLALARWKRFIFINTFVVGILAVAVSLLLPNWYRSTASVFPPEEESFALGSLSSLVAVSALGAGRNHLPVWASPSDVYAAILRSRTVVEAIIDEFDLMEVYKVDNLDVAMKILRAQVTVRVGGHGIIFIHVENKDPELAAAMANAFVRELDKVNRTKRTSAAGQARKFLDNRLQASQAALVDAEETLRSLQETTGILDPEEQVRGAVRALTQLETQIVLKEVELDILSSRLGPGHPDRASLEREVAEMRSKLRELETGEDAERTGLRELPKLSLDYLRAFREVQVHQALDEFLRREYESYRIQEERDTPTIYVLDPARPAEKKIRPKRSILCIGATVLAFLASLALVIVFEAFRRMRENEPERFARLETLAAEFKLRGLLRRVSAS